MVFLEYNLQNGYVVAIHETEPAVIPEGYGIAKASAYNFKPGDEFEYYIIVEEVNPEGEAVSIASVKQAPQATYLMQQLTQKEQQIKELQQVVADIAQLLLERGIL